MLINIVTRNDNDEEVNLFRIICKHDKFYPRIKKQVEKIVKYYDNINNIISNLSIISFCNS